MNLRDVNWGVALPVLVVTTFLIIAAAILIFWRSVIGGLIAGGTGVTGFIVGTGLYLLTNPAVLDRWLSKVYKAGRKIDTSFDRGYVRKDIEAVINSYNEANLGFEIPHGVQLDWERDIDRSTIIENDEVVICLNDGDHQSRNLAVATLEYTKNGIIPHARRHINENLEKGIDFCISLDILKNGAEKEAIRQLYEENILSDLESSTEDIDENPIKKSYDKVDETRKGGFLGPVLLTEFEKLTEHGMPNSTIRKETGEFVDFLETISESGKGEEVELSYDGDYINVSIGLMARSATSDLGPYEKMAKMNLAESETSYILAVGKNIPAAKEVAQNTKELPGVDSFHEVNYELGGDSNFGGEKDAYCARLERKEGVGN